MNPESSKPKFTGSYLSLFKQIKKNFLKMKDLMDIFNQEESVRTMPLSMCRILLKKYMRQLTKLNAQLYLFNNEDAAFCEELQQELTNYVNNHNTFSDNETAVHVIMVELREDSQPLREANAKELNEIKEQMNRNDEELAKIKQELDEIQMNLILKFAELNCPH